MFDLILEKDYLIFRDKLINLLLNVGIYYKLKIFFGLQVLQYFIEESSILIISIQLLNRRYYLMC